MAMKESKRKVDRGCDLKNLGCFIPTKIFVIYFYFPIFHRKLGNIIKKQNGYSKIQRK